MIVRLTFHSGFYSINPNYRSAVIISLPVFS